MVFKATFALPEKMYHGSSQADCAAIAAGGVNVSRGGGELGRGFYLGNYYHLAVQWAHHKFGRQAAVVSFTLSSFPNNGLSRKQLNRMSAVQARAQIRRAGEERTHLFGADTVHAHVVGGHVDRTAEQLKAESTNAENFLNGTTCLRKVEKA